jgi:hypothetical protein
VLAHQPVAADLQLLVGLFRQPMVVQQLISTPSPQIVVKRVQLLQLHVLSRDFLMQLLTHLPLLQEIALGQVPAVHHLLQS